MTAIGERSFDDLLGDAVAFHGHLCPGQVLGVRMTQAGCREAGIPDPRAVGKGLAYRDMAEEHLLTVERVIVHPAWIERRRVRVRCEACGEGVNYEREVHVGGHVLCRACGGGRYYLIQATGAPTQESA